MADDADTPTEEYPWQFRAWVVREVEKMGLDILDWRDGGLDATDAKGEKRFIGLANLFRRVCSSPSEVSEQIVRNFFESAQVDTQGESPLLPDSIDDAAEQLRIRIGKPFTDDDKAPWSMTLPGLDELALNLVVDYPTMMAFVTKPMMEASSAGPEHWLERGLDNVRKAAPENWLQLMHEKEGLWLGHVEDSYDAARALAICELTGSDELGWLIAIPARDWLFARKVDREGLQFFHFLKIFAERAYGEQPYPISDQVYWVRPGNRWMRFPIQVEDNQVTVSPPPEFAEALGLEAEELGAD